MPYLSFELMNEKHYNAISSVWISTAPAAAPPSKTANTSIEGDGEGIMVIFLCLSLEQPSILYVPRVKEQPARTHNKPPAPLSMLSPSLLGHLWQAIGWCAGERSIAIGWVMERNFAFLCISALQEKTGVGEREGTKMMMWEIEMIWGLEGEGCKWRRRRKR